MSLTNPNTKKERTAAQLKAAMLRAAKKALKRIEARRYKLRFQGKANKIYKMALVVGGYSDVLAIFEAADNWRLAHDPLGRLMVVPQ